MQKKENARITNGCCPKWSPHQSRAPAQIPEIHWPERRTISQRYFHDSAFSNVWSTIVEFQRREKSEEKARGQEEKGVSQVVRTVGIFLTILHR